MNTTSIARWQTERKAKGEVVGGGFMVLRRGKNWNRIRIKKRTKQEWFFSPFEWPTLELANGEAARLAKEFPGEKFCVFAQCGEFKVPLEIIEEQAA